ncbi:MAG: NAD(P)/FAD-dependent oxidoreductase [Dehalococcoidia bacterium]|nr:NAD(P)/FAD-dependent oxidoreductase [Dehalococcoidia bacterium]
MPADHHVVVVGAGPAGSVAARDIARHGWRVLLLEEHTVVGDPVHCSGLVTPRTLKAADLNEDLVVHRITGAIVHSPLGRQVTIGGDRERAFVLDRQRFDQALAEQAQKAGASLSLSSRFIGLEVSDDIARVTYDRGGASHTVTADLVVGADGSLSAVSRPLGLAKPAEAIAAIGGEVTGHALRDDLVEVFVDPERIPG